MKAQVTAGPYCHDVRVHTGTERPRDTESLGRPLAGWTTAPPPDCSMSDITKDCSSSAVSTHCKQRTRRARRSPAGPAEA